jgi:signal peptidase I
MGGKGRAPEERTPSLYGWWQKRSAARHARAEGRHLVKEAQRILKRKSYRIPTGIAADVQGRVTALEQALAADNDQNLEALREAITHLDEAMDQHLAFARKSTVREYSESIGVAVAVALLLRAFVVEAFQIPSGSMIPTLEVGDHIFVSKFSYGLSIPFTDHTKIFSEHAIPKRGDVVVFKWPNDHSIDYIKRVVGLPGDVLEMKDEELYVNGQKVERSRVPRVCNDGEAPKGGELFEAHDCELWSEKLGDTLHETIQVPGHGGRDFARTVVPPHHLFMMGDNRDNSSDSRFWGTVDLDLVKGRALIVWWSRGETDGWSPMAWLKAIHWSRFFQAVR